MPRYECDGCGACCKALIVEIDEVDLLREPKLIAASVPFKRLPGAVLTDDDGDPYEERVPGYGAGAMLACGHTRACSLLTDDNKCSIYPTRPTCCVWFAAGSEQCQLARGMMDLSPLEPVGRFSLPVLGRTA